MLPVPTLAARVWFVGFVSVAFLGVAANAPQLVTIGGAGLLALAVVLAITMPLSRRVRRERLEFAWWLAHGDPSKGTGAVTPGAPFEVRCFIRHRGVTPRWLAKLDPVVPGGTRIADDEPRTVLLEASSRTEFSFRLVAPAAGRVVLHGLATVMRGPLGLFDIPLYFPNPLSIRVLPRAAAHRSPTTRRATGLAVARAGRMIVRRSGDGTELREIREFQPGDPFKAIAWKASARAGKLLVREVEHEMQETRVLIVDVSGTMRGGAPGARKLDFAIEAAASESRRTLDDGDRIGLVTVDGRVLAHVPPDDGAPQMIRVYDALLSATEVVDQDLTDLDEDDLVGIVGRYVRHQDGVDLQLRGSSGWDIAMMAKHISIAMRDVPRGSDIIAMSSVSHLLRSFCRARGIPLPYRPDPRDGAKANGLAAAIRLAGGRTTSAVVITVVTDLDGLGDPEPLISIAKLVRARGHQLSFVVPDARTFTDAPKTRLETTLATVYGHGESRRVSELQKRLAPYGVTVVSASGKASPQLALARAHANRRVA